MTKLELCAKIGELKNTVDKEGKVYADGVITALDVLPDEQWQSASSVENFVMRLGYPDSVLDNVKNDFRAMYNELKAMMTCMKEQIQVTAKGNMRKQRKSRATKVVVVLAVIAVAALVLGILSALDIISVVYGSVIGAADCFLGISFFAYELYDDKVKGKAIDDGDADIIDEYCSLNINTGKARSKNGFANSGIIFRGVKDEPDKDKIKKLFDD